MTLKDFAIFTFGDSLVDFSLINDLIGNDDFAFATVNFDDDFYLFTLKYKNLIPYLDLSKVNKVTI